VHFVTKVSLYFLKPAINSTFFFIPIKTYFRKIFLGPLLQDDEILRGRFQKSYGGEIKFSMFVQDSLPIDTTISKCLSLLIKNCSKPTHPIVKPF
jgi:hypothetical protein